MRVAVVCPYDMGSVGGVQHQAENLVERLRQSGHDAFLVAPGAPPTLGVDVGASVGVPGNDARSPIALSPAAALRTRRAIEGADVVHVHEPMMPVVGPAALSARRPTVATFHAAVAPWTERAYRIGERIGDRLLAGARITAVSDTAAAGLPATWAPDAIVPNGVDVDAHRVDVEREPERVAFLGRDDPRKGLDVLLDAWEEIHERRPDARLSVIGATRPHGPAGVDWHGRVDEGEKRRLLARASIFAAPNLGGESFGIVLVEAMASGCAVVASDLSSFRAVLRDAGALVPVGRADALADRIVTLLGRPEELQRLASMGRSRATDFDWTTVVERYATLYEEAIDLAC